MTGAFSEGGLMAPPGLSHGVSGSGAIGQKKGLGGGEGRVGVGGGAEAPEKGRRVGLLAWFYYRGLP